MFKLETFYSGSIEMFLLEMVFCLVVIVFVGSMIAEVEERRKDKKP